MEQEVARRLTRKARWVLRDVWDEKAPQKSVQVALEGIVDGEVLEAWFAALDEDVWGEDVQEGGVVVEGMSAEKRRERGMFMTPDGFAEAMACAIAVGGDGGVGDGRTVLDLSAGCGALLAAAVRRDPGLRVVGVEADRGLAIAAALALYEARAEAGWGEGTEKRGENGGGPGVCGDRIYVGDGLSADGPWAAGGRRYEVVIGNPPYVGEKGNAGLFGALKEAHPHLADYFGARIDLLYLFFHRGLDLLAEGGRLIYLTSEYWLTASGAGLLRADLARRGRAELFVTFGSTAIFADAPGHHSLLSVFRRVGEDAAAGEGSRAWAVKVEERGLARFKEILEEFGSGNGVEGTLGWEGIGGGRVARAALPGGAGWAPFVDAATAEWGQVLRGRGSLLAELARDQQGVVSGADRVTRAHVQRFGWAEQGIGVGMPIFMFEEDEIPEELWAERGRLLRPVLRGSAVRKNVIFERAPGREWMLYVDGALSGADEALVVKHLGRFRAMLELRREVRTGAIPWYRLHWPRRRADFEGPKLVVARRGPKPCFALDLSGSVVSSDCTYLVAPCDVGDPVRYLASLMVVLNGAGVARYLAAFGKRKGAQLEFYAEPLRSLPLAVRRVGDGLEVIEGLWEGGSQRAFEKEVNALWERACIG